MPFGIRGHIEKPSGERGRRGGEGTAIITARRGGREREKKEEGRQGKREKGKEVKKGKRGKGIERKTRVSTCREVKELQFFVRKYYEFLGINVIHFNTRRATK